MEGLRGVLLSANDTNGLLARVAAAQKANPDLSESEILTQLLLSDLHQQESSNITPKIVSKDPETTKDEDVPTDSAVGAQEAPVNAPATEKQAETPTQTETFDNFFDMKTIVTDNDNNGLQANNNENNTLNSQNEIINDFPQNEVISQETVIRPPHLTRWTIQYDEEDGLPTILFYVGESPVCYIQITVSNFEEMLNQLNQIIIVPGESPITNWHIITPEGVPGAIEKPAPVLSLMSHGALVASMELDKAKVKKIVPRLLKIYNPAEEEGFVNKFNKFIARNKTIAIIAGSLIGIVTLGGLFTLIN